MLVKGHIFNKPEESRSFIQQWVCVCWLRYLAGMVQQGVGGCVCLCVCVRLLWGAQNARWCLLNSKSSPTLDSSSAVWTTCCLEWPASIQTGRILQHPKLPAASIFIFFLTGPFSRSFKCSMSSETPGEWRLPLEREKKLVQLGWDKAVLLPQWCPLLSKPIEERLEWQKQGGSVFPLCSQLCEKPSDCLPLP